MNDLTAENRIEIIKISDRCDLICRGAAWFHAKWGIPEEAYLESMRASSGENPVPEWYIVTADGDGNTDGHAVGEKIIAGLGVIENDFHDRTDLRPNICAVYTEPDFRGRGIAGALLDYAARDMKKRGVSVLYLVTNHDSFYERYGWEYLCPVRCDGEENPSRMYIHCCE